jgi:hypothetical protein
VWRRRLGGDRLVAAEGGGPTHFARSMMDDSWALTQQLRLSAALTPERKAF